jgi:hypothetical protein
VGVSLDLTSDEALVLFEFVWRYTESDRLEVTDQAEQIALWKLCRHLEKALVEPFDPAYDELLAAARQRLRDLMDDAPD